jgi:hypothetical protein
MDKGVFSAYIPLFSCPGQTDNLLHDATIDFTADRSPLVSQIKTV